MNPAPSIEQLYDYLFDKASSIVKDGVECVPVMLVQSVSGDAIVLMLPDMPTNMQAALLKRSASDPEVAAAALVTEAWYATADTASQEELRDIAHRRGLSEYPGRKEAIVINIMTPARQAVMICPIDRTTNSVEKAPFQWVDEQKDAAWSGRYVRPAAILN